MDRQGSVIAQSNTAGTVTQTYAYGPYGEPQAWGGSRFSYTGQIALPEVALYHYKARVYDPKCGCFLQTDPVGYKDNLDLYEYVGDDPLNHADPTGLTCSSSGDKLTCQFDQVENGKMTDAERGRVNAAYTKAVKFLLAHFDRDVTFRAGDKQCTVKAGELAARLEHAKVIFDSKADPERRASTFGGQLTGRMSHGEQDITINRSSIQEDDSHGTRHIDRDLSRTFVHESGHTVREESVMWGVRNFDDAHQAGYNKAAREALDGCTECDTQPKQ